MARLGDKWMIQTPEAGGWSPWKEMYTAYAAECESITPVQAEPHPDFRRTMGSTFRLYGSKPKGTMTAVWLVGDSSYTAQDVLMVCTSLRTALQHCRLKLDGTEIEYECIMTSWQPADTGVGGYHRVTVKWDALQMYPLQTHQLTPGEWDIPNPGTADVGMDVVVTVTQESLALQVLDFVLMQVKPGEVWRINGRTDGQVTCDGKPALSRTGYYDTPRLKPGVTRVTCPAECTMEVTYQPIYV